MELLATGERIGYLLKTRITDVDEFIQTLERIVRGGSVIDPALVAGAGQDATAATTRWPDSARGSRRCSG